MNEFVHFPLLTVHSWGTCGFSDELMPWLASCQNWNQVKTGTVQLISCHDVVPDTPISQIPQCTSPISHNAPFCNINVHMCPHFCYNMVYRGLWDWCIVGFGQQVYTLKTPQLSMIRFVASSWWQIPIKKNPLYIICALCGEVPVKRLRQTKDCDTNV